MRPDEERLLCSGSFLRKDLALLLTSRQLHAETALHPYKLGFFDFQFDYDYLDEDDWREAVIRGFLQARSQQQIDGIAKMEVSTHRMNFTTTIETYTGVEWVRRLRGS